MDHEEGSTRCDVEAVVAKMDLWAKQLSLLDLIFEFRDIHRVIFRGRLAIPSDGSYGSYNFWVDCDIETHFPFGGMILNPGMSSNALLDPSGRMVFFDGIYVLERTFREEAETADVAYADLLKSGKC